MRIIHCEQRSEEWERLRARPTASQFYRFITPARGDYAADADKYASEVVARQLGIHVEPPPSFWMEWGVEHESEAREAYSAHTGLPVETVGFIMPDDTDEYGGSPDGLVGDDGLLEIKCPAPPTLIYYHAKNKLPNQYKPQIQGLLMISGRRWCDFWAYHPALPPFTVRVEADEKYQEKIRAGLARLLEEIHELQELMRSWL